jgi:hypothetical protein
VKTEWFNSGKRQVWQKLLRKAVAHIELHSQWIFQTSRSIEGSTLSILTFLKRVCKRRHVLSCTIAISSLYHVLFTRNYSIIISRIIIIIIELNCFRFIDVMLQTVQQPIGERLDKFGENMYALNCILGTVRQIPRTLTQFANRHIWKYSRIYNQKKKTTFSAHKWERIVLNNGNTYTNRNLRVALILWLWADVFSGALF